MKLSTTSLLPLCSVLILFTFTFTTINAAPTRPIDSLIARDDAFPDSLLTRSIAFDLAESELERRGIMSKIGGAVSKVTSIFKGKGGSSPDPDRKAKYDTGNPKPETPVGEFRQHTAGKKDDYFGDWQTMTQGVNNPAAGKGKKKREFDVLEERFFDLDDIVDELERRGIMSKIGGAVSKVTSIFKGKSGGSGSDPDRKAKFDTGNPKPETPVGEFRQHTAGKKDDYFGDWQTMTQGVNNPAAGKGKKKRGIMSKIGGVFSKVTSIFKGKSGSSPDPDRKAKYDTGNPKPETPVGEFRQHTAGKKDDYFGDWQTMTQGVNNPAAGKGKKAKRYFEELEERYFDLDLEEEY